LNVLIVEDDESVARFLRQAMLEAGYAPQVAEDGLTGYQLAKTNPFDLILLDVMLPGLTGFEVCRRLRGDGISTPILILTAKDLLDDKVMGLDSGADDYLVKPFQIAELLARARALLRRRNLGTTSLKVGDLSLEPTSRQIVRGGKAISLSATEYALLEYLMRNSGRVLTRAMILQHVWQYDFDGNDKVLDVYISYLRRKIDRGHQNSLIQTVRGVGYCMENTDA
jgi:DNA-binding response OmpR family regulator